MRSAPELADVDRLTSAEGRVLGQAFAGLKEDIGSIHGTLTLISDALAKLTVIEANQRGIHDSMERAFEEIRRVETDAREWTKEFNRRLQPIEIALPQLIELRRWVMVGVLGGLGMMGVAMVSLVLK